MWLQALLHGAMLATVACALIAATLRIHPRLFLADFPREVRERMSPKSTAEKRASALVGVVLIGWVVGFLLYSTGAAEARFNPSYPELWAYAFCLGMMFNAADWLILDELWLGLGRPRWLTGGDLALGDLRFDHRKHFADFLKGSVGFAVLGAGVAAAVALF